MKREKLPKSRTSNHQYGTKFKQLISATMTTWNILSVQWTTKTAKDRGFLDRVENNSARYISLLHKVIDSNKPAPSVNLSEDDMSSWDILGQ